MKNLSDILSSYNKLNKRGFYYTNQFLKQVIENYNKNATNKITIISSK